MGCIFCQIVKKELPAGIVYEDERFVVFKDIVPKAPLHLLIIPKKHIASINEIGTADKDLVAEILLLAKEIAKEQKTEKSGYRLIFNIGPDSGQTVDHLHLHLMGGGQLPWP